jgi:cobalt-zinc-cadmium efflux system membrane fusion protein
VAARAKAAAVGLDGAGQPGALASPIEGEVIQRQAVAGQFVGSLASGASTPLFTVTDLHRVWVVGSLGERDAARVRVGQAVDITPAAGPRTIRARVDWVAPTVDPQSRRIAFRAVVPNADLSLKPMMTARMRVLDPKAAPALAIPASAVIFDGPAAHCFVVSGPRQLTLRPLTVGRSEGGLVEVLSGLRPDERVVARGAIFIDALAEGGAS